MTQHAPQPKEITKPNRGIKNVLDYTIRLGIDAHGDKYFTLLNGNYIVAERINSAEDVILFLKAKLYSVANS